MDKAAASCLGVREGGIRRSARISVAKPVDLGIDAGVLAAEVACFVAAEERRQVRCPSERHDGGVTRNARMSIARPVDLGVDPGMLAAAVAEFVAATERRQAGRRAKRARRRARAGAATSGVVIERAPARQDIVEGDERMQVKEAPAVHMDAGVPASS